MSDASPQSAEASSGPASEPRLRLSGGAVLCVLAGTLALQSFSWSTLHGYQLADSVEYMERAQGYLFGHEVLGPSSVRSFAFSALFLPFFWLADRLGIDDMRFLVPLFRVGIMGLGLALTWKTMRIASIVSGRAAGLAAGVLIGTNPIFLQYTISPVSGIAAALCVACGVERALERGSFRHHVAGGLWLGAGFMMAYQTLPIALSLVLLIFLRDRLSALRSTLGTLTGLFCGLFGQVVLDRVSYGEWGSSIFRYVLDNAGGVMVRVLNNYLGLTDLALALYEKIEELQPKEYEVLDPNAADVVIQDMTPAQWYLENLTDMLVWPALALLALGVARSLVKPRWATIVLVLCFALNAFVLSQKGSKSFRLWLPLLPFLVPLCAHGAGLLWPREAPLKTLRRLAFAAALVTLPVFGVLALQSLNTRRFGIFWETIDWVNESIEDDWRDGILVGPHDPPVGPEGYGAGRVKISGAYHWSMFLRESPLSYLSKLPYEIDGWPVLPPERKQRNLDTIETLDWYVAHLPSLVNHPDLMGFVNGGFAIEASFYSFEAEPGLAAVIALRRRHDKRDPFGSRTFWSLAADADIDAHCERFSFVQPISFERTLAGGEREQLLLLGWEFEALPGSRLGWVSYHWTTPTGLSDDVTIIDRISAPDRSNSWQNNHQPAYGTIPASSLARGAILRESYLVVAGVHPFSIDLPFEPLGGEYLDADAIPASLWMKVATYDADGTETDVLWPVDPATGERFAIAPKVPPTPRGYAWNDDGMLRVGSFLLPRHDDSVLTPRNAVENDVD